MRRNGKQRDGKTQETKRQFWNSSQRNEYSHCFFGGREIWEVLRFPSEPVPPASLPLLSSAVYRDPFLNSCPPGLALAPAPGLQPDRHPDRLQMSVGVGLRQALVLRVWRRRINGLYSLPVPSQSEESDGGTPVFFSPNPDPTNTQERKGVRIHSWASGPPHWISHSLSKLSWSILEN